MSSSSANPFCSSSFYENPSPSLLMNIPNSMLDDEDMLLEHFLHHQPQLSTSIGVDQPKESPPAKEGRLKRKRIGSRKPLVSTSRRRVGKKDRHSKIYTAQGPRDRRMRLSLQVARKFFDLQDMLGYDKASKTIEWLFSNSKSAIRELTSSLQLPSPIAGSCTSCDDDHKKDGEVDMKGMKGMKSSNLSSFTKESREKARARARQRTMEKKKQKGLMLLKANPNSNSSETVDQVESGVSGGGHEFNSRSEPVVSQSQSSMENLKSSFGIIEKLLGSDSSAASYSSIYDHNFLGCAENWVVDSMSTNLISYGAMSGGDELQVILQQKKP